MSRGERKKTVLLLYGIYGVMGELGKGVIEVVKSATTGKWRGFRALAGRGHNLLITM